MSIIDYQSSTWTDPWFRKLPTHCKLLFIYLWTNNHKNLTGLYAIDIATIGFETGLTSEQIREGLSILHPKVKYDYKKEIIWVVNHVRHQFMRTKNISYKIIVGIEKALISLNKHPFIKEFLDKYSDLEIQYQYPMDSVSIYPSSEGGGEGAGKGEGECKERDKIDLKKMGDKTFEDSRG